MPTQILLIIRTADGSLTYHKLAAGTHILGREADCEVVIPSADVSRHHARLILQETDFQIVDLGSTLGTKLNGQPLRGPQRAKYPAMLQLGSVNVSLKPAESSADYPAHAESIAPLAADPDAGVPYVFQHEIACGGMGSILEAQDCKLGRNVAVKLMLSNLSDDELQQQRFINEAAVLGRLEHPNIVPIHDIGRDSAGNLFYSMKLVHGRTLQAIINALREGDSETLRQYTLDRLLTIFRKVCDAMAFAHSRGIIHRDLKPENVMVGEFGEVLVMDWGLAKSLHETDRQALRDAERPRPRPAGQLQVTNFGMTLEGDIMGTPQYMSPEQAEGRVADMDARSDIFSLGGILYAVLTLSPPVEGSTLEEVLQKVVVGQFTAPSALNAPTTQTTAKSPGKGEVLEPRKIKPLPHCPGGRVPAALSAVVMKALRVDKAFRYQKVSSFAADVEAYQGGFATSAEDAGALKQLTLLVKRHKAVSIALLVLLLVGSASITNIVLSQHRMALTLAELRDTAPTFSAQAGALVDQGHLEDALAKISYAIRLDPPNPAYHLQQADLLEASQRLPEAIAAYHETLALDAGNKSALVNLALCERLLGENGGAAPLRRDLQVQLFHALDHEGRAVEAGALALQLGEGGAALEAALRARLQEYVAQPGWSSSRVRRLIDGTFEVQLHHLHLGDLSVLRGMPISVLVLAGTDFSDLKLLAGLPLTVLDISGTQVADLSLLHGSKLEYLNCGNTAVTSLEPLRGLPLHRLVANSSQVTDLSPLIGLPLQDLNLQGLKLNSLAPLRGLPIRHLDLGGAGGDQDMSALTSCRDLEEIIVSNSAGNIESLRSLPKLARLRFDGFQPSLVPAPQFWSEFNPADEGMGTIQIYFKKHGYIRKAGSVVTRLGDGTLAVSINQTVVPDLEFLRGLPVSQLTMYDTKISDLSPLRGAPLTMLSAFNTTITDIEALRGCPLTWVNLLNTPVTSVAPLRGCPTLEVVALPHHARDVETLRSLSKLRLISYIVDSQSYLPNKTAAQFWQEFDAQKNTAPSK